MCGRFTQRFSWREVHSFLRLGRPGPALNLRPRYNVAPSQNAAVVRDEDGERRLSMLRWGLIPGWAKDPNIGHKLINARAETAAVKPAFRAAYSRRQCLVPADGFYEWRREGEVRQPWLIAPRDGGIVAFAGLNEAKGGARTYVARDGDRVAGFYSLAASSVERRRVSSRVGRGMPDPVPVILLGQLAVDEQYRARRLGSDLLVDAAGRCLSAAGVVGARAIVVQAIDGRAAAFYAKFGFRPFSGREPLMLILRMSEIEGLLRA